MNISTEESYYKILGTTAKISQGRIKEKYIQAVKQHPPETDPEKFEKIRQAYDVLKDPLKRKEYDMKRKYGGEIEKMLEKAAYHQKREEYNKANKIYQDLLIIDKNNLSGKMGLMITYPTMGELDLAYRLFHELHEKRDELEEIGVELGFIYSLFADALHKNDYSEEAYDLLEEGLNEHYNSSKYIVETLISLCVDMDKDERAMEVVEMLIPSEEEETVEDLDYYIAWILVISQTGHWSRLSKVQSRLRKFLRKLENEEDRASAFYTLMYEYEEAYEVQAYRIADVFIDFAKTVSEGVEDIKEEIKEVKKLVRVEKDMNRLLNDKKIFPLVLRDAVYGFFAEGHPLAEGIKSEFTLEFVQKLEKEEEYYAAGILYLKKKYPALYHHTKEEWDSLFEDLTEDFNREMKRGLKKLM